MSDEWRDAIHDCRDIFRRHGFDSNSIDFSDVKPASIRAMATALVAIEPPEKKPDAPKQYAWCWSLLGFENWNTAETREIAIAEGSADATAHGRSKFFIGQCDWSSHENMVSRLGEVVREHLSECAYDVAGEHGDEYPDMKSDPFDEALETFVLSWLNAHAAPSRFFTVDDEEEVSVVDEEE